MVDCFMTPERIAVPGFGMTATERQMRAPACDQEVPLSTQPRGERLPTQLIQDVVSDFEDLVAFFNKAIADWRGEQDDPAYLALTRGRDAATNGVDLSRRLNGRLTG